MVHSATPRLSRRPRPPHVARSSTSRGRSTPQDPLSTVGGFPRSAAAPIACMGPLQPPRLSRRPRPPHVARSSTSRGRSTPQDPLSTVGGFPRSSAAPLALLWAPITSPDSPAVHGLPTSLVPRPRSIVPHPRIPLPPWVCFCGRPPLPSVATSLPVAGLLPWPHGLRPCLWAGFQGTHTLPGLTAISWSRSHSPWMCVARGFFFFFIVFFFGFYPRHPTAPTPLGRDNIASPGSGTASPG